jgi:dipeptide/tripeptide permease
MITQPKLRRVPDRIPWVVLLILIVELGERFTYFGLSAPIQNYIKYVKPSGQMHHMD